MHYSGLNSANNALWLRRTEPRPASGAWVAKRRGGLQQCSYGASCAQCFRNAGRGVTRRRPNRQPSDMDKPGMPVLASPMTLLEEDRDRSLRYTRSAVEACQNAVKAVGVKFVSTVSVVEGTAFRDAFLADLARARRPLVEIATNETLKLQSKPGSKQSPSDPHWMVVGIASLHERVIDFAFVCDKVGGTTADIHRLYGGSLDTATAAGVRARLNEFNKAFFNGSLDVALVGAYYAQMNGPKPQPASQVDLFALYVYVLAHGGYYSLPFFSVWTKLGSDPKTNPTYLRALYRACLHPYEKQHVGGPSSQYKDTMFAAAVGDPGANVAVGTGSAATRNDSSSGAAGAKATHRSTPGQAIGIATKQGKQAEVSHPTSVGTRQTVGSLPGPATTPVAGLVPAANLQPSNSSAPTRPPRAPLAQMLPAAPTTLRPPPGPATLRPPPARTTLPPPPPPAPTTLHPPTTPQQIQFTPGQPPLSVTPRPPPAAQLQHSGVAPQSAHSIKQYLELQARKVVSEVLLDATRRGLVANSDIQNDFYATALNTMSVALTSVLHAGQAPPSNAAAMAMAAAKAEVHKRVDFFLQRRGQAAPIPQQRLPIQGQPQVGAILPVQGIASQLDPNANPARPASVRGLGRQPQPAGPGVPMVPQGAVASGGFSQTVQPPRLAASASPVWWVNSSMSPQEQADARRDIRRYDDLQKLIVYQNERILRAGAAGDLVVVEEARKVLKDALKALKAVTRVAQTRLNGRSQAVDEEKRASATAEKEVELQAELQARALVKVQAAALDLARDRANGAGIDIDKDKNGAEEQANGETGLANGTSSGDGEPGAASEAGPSGDSERHSVGGDGSRKSGDASNGASSVAAQHRIVAPGPPPFKDGDRSSSFVSSVLKKVSELSELSKENSEESNEIAELAGHAASAVGTVFVCLPQEQREAVIMPTSGLTLGKLRADFSTDLRMHLEKTHGVDRCTHTQASAVDLFDLFVVVLRFGGMKEVLLRKQVGLLADEISGSKALHGDVIVATYLWLLGTYEAKFLSIARQSPPLLHAALNGDVPRVSIMLSQGAAIDYCDSHGNSSLHAAAHTGCLLLAEHLLARGAVVDICNNAGVSPLALAATRGHALMVSLLLECGADPELVSGDGKTTMFYAVAQNRLEVVEVLLEAGVDASALVHPEMGLTGLHIAAARGKVEMITLLAEYGAEVEAGDKHSRTALHFAVYFNSLLAAVKLLRLGSDPKGLTGRNQDALDIAMAQGHGTVAAVLDNVIWLKDGIGE